MLGAAGQKGLMRRGAGISLCGTPAFLHRVKTLLPECSLPTSVSPFASQRLLSETPAPRRIKPPLSNISSVTLSLSVVTLSLSKGE